MIDLTQERDVETLRQISLLLERENQRLITKTLQLTAELARARGLPNPEQLALAELHALEQRRAQLLAPPPDMTSIATPSRPPRPGHGPRSQPALPVVEIRHELPPDHRACRACAGELTEMTGQTEGSGGSRPSS
jgi:transposase